MAEDEFTVVEAKRVLREVIRPILMKAQENYPGAAHVSEKGPGPRICLAVTTSELAFLVEVVSRSVRVIHEHIDRPSEMIDSLRLSEITEDRVQSYVDDFVALITPSK